jgi:hypothetical protein
MQRFELSPNDTNKLLTQEPLLIVRLPILKPGDKGIDNRARYLSTPEAR